MFPTYLPWKEGCLRSAHCTCLDWWKCREMVEEVSFPVYRLLRVRPKNDLNNAKKKLSYRAQRNEYTNEKPILLSCPLVRTGVSVARWAAVTDLVWSVPVLAGDEFSRPFPPGCRARPREKGKKIKVNNETNEGKLILNKPHRVIVEAGWVEFPVGDCVLLVFSFELLIESCAASINELQPTYLSRLLMCDCQTTRPHLDAGWAWHHREKKRMKKTWKVIVANADVRIRLEAWRFLLRAHCT